MYFPDPCVGEIRDPCVQKCIEWKIGDYFSLLQKTDTYICSPVFHFLNASWFLRLCPNGERQHNSVGWLSVYLHRDDIASECICLSYTIGIKYGQEAFSNHSYFESTNFYGAQFLIDRTDLVRMKHVYAPHNTLTIFLQVKGLYPVVDSASQTDFSDGIKVLAEDFGNLLNSEQKSDVTIKLKGRLFRVHKLILGARSSVFSAMFERNMKENNSGIVQIADCEPDAFHDFLTYMYTGTVANLSSVNVTNLYSLADKYDMSDLKHLCLDFMKKNLNLDTVCAVMVIADQHNEEQLKKSAGELIRKNFKNIILTEQWISFISANPILASEIFMTLISLDEQKP